MAIRIDYTPITGLANLAAQLGQEQAGASRQQQASQVYQNEIMRRQQVAQQQQMAMQSQQAAQELQQRQMAAQTQQQQFSMQHQLAQQELVQRAEEARMRDMATRLQTAARMRIAGTPTGSAQTRVNPLQGTYSIGGGPTMTHTNQQAPLTPEQQQKVGVIDSMRSMLPTSGYEALRTAALSEDMGVDEIVQQARLMQERGISETTQMRVRQQQQTQARAEANRADSDLRRVQQQIAQMERDQDTDNPLYTVLQQQASDLQARKQRAESQINPNAAGQLPGVGGGDGATDPNAAFDALVNQIRG